MSRASKPVRDARRVRELLTAAEVKKFEGYASEIFYRLGLEPGPGTTTRPQRWLQAMIDMTSGYDGDPKIRTIFPNELPGGRREHLGHIVEGPIPLISSCEHHIVSIIGDAYIGYVAGDHHEPRPQPRGFL